MNIGFDSAEILLPNFNQIDGTRWSVVACDQYTSEPAYWEAVAATVGDAPSTLSMILPEVYLSETEKRIPRINQSMQTLLDTLLVSHPGAMIALERTQSDGCVRLGLIGAVDLEQYDYRKGSDSLIRATEGTVLERIPPRVAVRRNAPLELPHVMLLIDDPHHTVIEPTLTDCQGEEPLYDFDLMLGGGHVRAYALNPRQQANVKEGLASLITPSALQECYGDPALAPLLFAVGDGNHSLASAKAAYEEVKAAIGEEPAKTHPARYALVEVVNLHDAALQFEPIYRVVFHCDPADLLTSLKTSLSELHGTAPAQTFRYITAVEEGDVTVPHPTQQLTVGTLQRFLDDYLQSHPEVEVDYIHGEDSLRSLITDGNTVGFLFDGMRKDELFRTVIYDGALPRKTFSMGHAPDKRYYLECRKIK
ncbi:MAG: DUF1015 domain-containing protein [Clostridia bacterium]|nr:DUF1015 domain-containing protein [Clostridia bacterium]